MLVVCYSLAFPSLTVYITFLLASSFIGAAMGRKWGGGNNTGTADNRTNRAKQGEADYTNDRQERGGSESRGETILIH